MPELPVCGALGEPFNELDTVDSTNNYALSKAYAGLTRHGEVFFAREQELGKGQRGKTWAATPGSSILMSIVIQPEIPPHQQFHLSAAIAVAVAEAFSNWAGDATRIKWPNDIYWHDRKAGGILIENIIRSGLNGEAQWRFAIAGIGINLNQSSFPENLSNPVSLLQITGSQSDPVKFAKEICEVVNETYTELCRRGPERILKTYNDRLYSKDQVYIFRQGNRRFEATVKAVTSEGRLVLEHAIIEEFGWGEIEWLEPKK